MQSPVLPSPLCDKELEELIFTAGRRRMSDTETNQSESDGEAAAVLKASSPQLPCWTSSAILTSEVCGVCSVKCKQVYCIQV